MLCNFMTALLGIELFFAVSSEIASANVTLDSRYDDSIVKLSLTKISMLRAKRF